MSNESLSQNQVENLLKAMETADLDEEGTDAPTEANDSADSKPAKDAEGSTVGSSAPVVGAAHPADSKPYSPGVPTGARVTAYDFKRPERVGKDQMRAMHSLHESIARNFGASISGLLRTMIEVKLLSVDQLTYSEFVFSLDNPSCFNIIKPLPLEGHWVLDIAPGLAYAIIDRMLGGDPVPGETIRRPLTEIETRLMCRVVDLFLEQIVPAWENVIQLEPSIHTTESNPQLAQIVPPNEVAILVGFEVLLGKNRGMMNLCIPFNSIEKYNAKLSRNGWVGYGKTNPTPQSRRKIAGSIDAAPVDVVVTLARSKIRTSDLLDLSIGDIITTEQAASSALELSVQDVHKFAAVAGAYKGKKAVQVQSTVEPKHSEPEPDPEEELENDSPAAAKTEPVQNELENVLDAAQGKTPTATQPNASSQAAPTKPAPTR
ncbi:flagellar motor switch protein FliM [Rhodopirellula europaea]|uniref:Flagellar motor switch protein FliM n=1 Tax=Rhodopirellula europaea SH398 TaxID=1263868 RepID=M5SC44_9BACT|nr:flagellar motor switch protein FliM [Rhodopirellula europaea]EMI29223.1 flagellar motor switch protein fliM [Rhodopirellula europaea SH398]